MSYPGDTTTQDWDGKSWWFWRTDEHGKRGLARTTRVRGQRRPDSPRYVFCDEHNDWEARRFLISADTALAWALDRAQVSLKGKEKVGS